MNKISNRLFIAGLTVMLMTVFAGCKDDFTNWAEPQANEQNQPNTTTLPVIEVTSAVSSTIDFATVTTDSMVLFTVKPIVLDNETIQVDTFRVEMTRDGSTNHATIPASPEGKIAMSDLDRAVVILYGHAGKDRVVHVTVTYPAPLKAKEGAVAVKCVAEPFDITVKLVPPTIANAYYFFMDGELSQEMTKKEDGVFTIVFPGNSGRKNLWLTFIDDVYTTFNPQEQQMKITDWDYVYGYGAEEFAPRIKPLSGAILRRNEQKKNEQGGYDDNNFHVDGSSPYYRFTVDMMEHTYLIEPLAATGDEPKLEVQSEVSSTIHLAGAADSLTLFSVVGTPIVSQYDVHFTCAEKDTTVTRTATTQGRIASADLIAVVQALYGNAGKERTLNVQVAERIDVPVLEGKYKGTSYAAPFTIKAQLAEPQISAHYYLFGAMGDKLEFTRSEEDPHVFTYVFEGNGGTGNMWFVIVDEENVNEWDKIIDWNEVFTYGEGYSSDPANSRQSGKYQRRSEIPGGPHGSRSFNVDGTYKYYRVMIDAYERTYKIDGVNKRIE